MSSLFTLNPSGHVVMENVSGDWFRMTVPLEGAPANLFEASDFQSVQCVQTEDGLEWTYGDLVKDGTPYAIRAKVNLHSNNVKKEHTVQLYLENDTDLTIPQVMFPSLNNVGRGLRHDRTHFVLARNSFEAFNVLRMDPDEVTFYDLPLKKFYTYPFSFDFSMKWFDIHDGDIGLSVYSKDLSSDLQGIHIERPSRNSDFLRIDWVSFPNMEAQTSWTSCEYVLHAHEGDWHQGIKPYKRFANAHFPPLQQVKRLVNGLGYMTLWMRELMDTRIVHKTFRDLPAMAEEAKLCGLNEIVLWFAVDKGFGLPLQLHSSMGEREEIERIVNEVKAMGVNLSIFVSCNLIPPDDNRAEWFCENEVGAKIGDNWTYDWKFVPSFKPLINSECYSYYTCPGSKGWREAYDETVRYLNGLGLESICYDQLFVISTCHNPLHSHNPIQLHRLLYDMMKDYKEQARALNPNATFSSEFIADVTSSFQDYTWEWTLYKPYPFKSVFPRNYMNVMVDGSIRKTNQAFMEGFFLNVYPDHGRGKLSDRPDFMAYLQKLAAFKRKWAPFMNEGEYLHTEGLGDDSRSYCRVWRQGDELLLLINNPEDESRQLELVCALNELLPGGATYRIDRFNLEMQHTDQFISTNRLTQSISFAPLELQALVVKPTLYS